MVSMILKIFPNLLKNLKMVIMTLLKEIDFLILNHLKKCRKIKMFGNLITTNIQKIVSGNYAISDPNNGFLAIRSSKLKLINLNQLNNEYFFENSLSIIFNAYKFKIAEIGIETIYKNEKSSIPIFLAGIKIIPVFFILLFKKNILTAKLQLSINSIIFFLGILIFSINLFLQIQFLWILLLSLIFVYLLIDIVNFLST